LAKIGTRFGFHQFPEISRPLSNWPIDKLVPIVKPQIRLEDPTMKPPIQINRRSFLKTSAIVSITSPAGVAGSRSPIGQNAGSGDDIYLRLVKANDAHIARQAEPRRQDQSRQDPAGFQARMTAYQVHSLAAAFCAPESRHYNSPELVTQMEAAAEALLKAQHPDGTIDSGNLQSPPDSAFVAEPLCVALVNLLRSDSDKLLRLKDNLKTFLLSAGEALTTGGVHTPNHRWGVCAALARINSLYPSPKYVRRIDEWLSEGIDIDADGQFSERSTGNYSEVTDNWLITVARLLGREKLFDPARRNLEMILYYTHPDGELESIASRRQDQFSRRSLIYSNRPAPDTFHLPYRYLALRDRNGQFAAMTRLIEEKAGEQLAGNLGYFLEEPLLREALPPSTPLPADYARFFPNSGLARIRRDKISATIYGGSDHQLGIASGLASNPTFFTYRKGAAVLESVRMAPQFFRTGFFYSSGLKLDGKRYLLQQRLEVPYYQPLPREQRRVDGDYPLTPAGDRFWSKMNFPAREKSNIKTLEQQVAVTENEGRFELQVHVSGIDRIPVTLEFCFRRGGKLQAVTPSPDSTDDFFLEQGTGRYQFGNETIDFGPGQVEHRWTRLESEAYAAYGGSIRPDGLRVYITGMTPFHKIITVG
jgi:hypothetical protein